MRPLELRADVTTSTATAYRFLFKDGWAIFTVNDETGEFGLQSDWGAYGYRWYPAHLPTGNLTRFLASKGRHQYDCDYIVEKMRLATQSKELDEVVDCAATRRAIDPLILKDRRQQELSREKARELWEQLGDWEASDFDLSYVGRELSDYLGAPYEYVRHGESGRHLVLRDELLPYFCRWLNENVVAKRESQAVYP